MAYEHKAGELTLFKNERKENDRQPDYKGRGCGLDGQPLEIAGWLRQGQRGTFMSIRISVPRDHGDTDPGNPATPAAPAPEGAKNELPDLPF